MNTLKGKISAIEVNGSLSLVSVKVDSIQLKTIVVETPETAGYLKVGNNINVLFKETEVIIGTDTNHQISLQNRIKGKLIQLEKGKLLSKLLITTEVGNIVSIITSNAVEQLNLEEQQEIIAMIKTNEILLAK